ncbi:MAG: serine dehydratase subunit alpha family protein [Candidatus Izemoplasmatales bacterium]
MTHEKEFFQILQEELVPALGCTEPIAIAFAGAKAKEVLGVFPKRILVRCSGSLLKNIKCVSVPNSSLHGVEPSVLAGLVAGDSSLGMEVLSKMTPKDDLEVERLLKINMVKVELLESPLNLHFIVRFESEEASCEVEIQNLHTNVTRISKNDQIIYQADSDLLKYYGVLTDRRFLSVDNIFAFVESAPVEDLKIIMGPQVQLNMTISEEGFSGDYGVSIGNAILKKDRSVYGKMKAAAASASEARMCGSALPVVTNSGSGNQGIASSVPVIVYAKEHRIDESRMYRALALSNLLTIYQKNFIGRLSAFCGAISASSGAGAAITYLAGGSLDQIKMTIVNSLADVSGVFCDGAKASCASKIATSLEAAFIGHAIAMENKVYPAHSGILGKDADDTIAMVGRIASEGMQATNDIILKVMMEKNETC